jgi:hypothetical protein
MRMITLAALAALALTAAPALAEDGDNPVRDVTIAAPAPAARALPDAAFTGSVNARASAEQAPRPVEDIREYQLWNPSR